MSNVVLVECFHGVGGNNNIKRFKTVFPSSFFDLFCNNNSCCRPLILVHKTNRFLYDWMEKVTFRNFLTHQLHPNSITIGSEILHVWNAFTTNSHNVQQKMKMRIFNNNAAKVFIIVASKSCNFQFFFEHFLPPTFPTYTKFSKLILDFPFS